MAAYPLFARDDADDLGLIPDAEVARLLNVNPKTPKRWDEDPKLNYPKPVYINGRKYRKRGELKSWIKSLPSGKQPKTQAA